MTEPAPPAPAAPAAPSPTAGERGRDPVPERIGPLRPDRARYHLSVGPELAVRPQIWPAAGLAAALTPVAHRIAATARISLRAPRPTGFTTSSTVFEAVAEVGAELPRRGFDLTCAAGAAWRWWREPVHTSTGTLVPHASGGISRDLRLGPIRLELAAALELDLALTKVRVQHYGASFLFPVGLRTELRVH